MEGSLAFARDARLRALRGDITALRVDAVVNAANAELAGGGGVDGAIHRAAGGDLDAACAAVRDARRPGPACPTGTAVATPGFRLPAAWILHTAGPVWGRDREADRLLASCYTASLDAAREKGARSVAFPNISTGVYGFPKERAAGIAVRACLDWLSRADGDRPGSCAMEIVFVCFDRENEALYRAEAAIPQ